MSQLFVDDSLVFWGSSSASAWVVELGISWADACLSNSFIVTLSEVWKYGIFIDLSDSKIPDLVKKCSKRSTYVGFLIKFGLVSPMALMVSSITLWFRYLLPMAFLKVLRMRVCTINTSKTTLQLLPTQREKWKAQLLLTQSLKNCISGTECGNHECWFPSNSWTKTPSSTSTFRAGSYSCTKIEETSVKTRLRYSRNCRLGRCWCSMGPYCNSRGEPTFVVATFGARNDRCACCWDGLREIQNYYSDLLQGHNGYHFSVRLHRRKILFQHL